MSGKPDLLVKDNLVRHLSEKIARLDEIKDFVASCDQSLILDSLLATTISYFDAAILDTVREYVCARPDEIRESMLDELNKCDKKKLNKNKIAEMGFEDYLTDAFMADVAFKDIKGKLKILRKLTGIEVDLGNERWAYIREAIARRNCFIHNDLVANNTYFSQAGKEADQRVEKLEVTISYLSEQIENIQSLLEELKGRLEKAYEHRDNIAAVRELWDYLFENHYPMFFDECWDTTGDLMRYKGPKIKDLEEATSPRVICLFTAWKSFFNGAANRELKYFPDIFYNNAKDRAMYSKKLKYLMDCFEKIDFQSFKVQVYNKG